MIPQHVAIIMDGNGRWAKLKGRPRVFGHIRGSTRVRPVVRECGKLGVKYLTLFCFSAENWGRPRDEVQMLMRILQKYLVRERKTLMENNVKLTAIGDVNSLPQNVLDVLEETIELTKNNTGLVLTFALSYGSRQEITRAMQRLALEVREGKLDPVTLSEEDIERNLFTSDLPDPDFIIRSSGESRISNFLLWQSAYSELYITNTLWPDFDLKELHMAFREFSRRERRFGLVVEAPTQGAQL